MEKMKRFDLQNAEILDKKGMKEITGGNDEFIDHIDNGDNDHPAKVACEGKNEGADCIVGSRTGKCKVGLGGVTNICWIY